MSRQSETLLSNNQKLIEALFFLILAGYCAWVLSFPLFPTQDGPVHLYYTWVLEQVSRGSALFSQYFAVRHPIPPYVIHYLLLYVLMKSVSPLIAEKLVVCLIVVLFATGARYFLKSLGGSYWIGALAALPLALNWMVGMGFHNYCLSLGLSFFAMGCWVRAMRQRRITSHVLFLLLIALMLFTHPVPVFITLAFATGTLALSILQAFWIEGASFSKWRDLRDNFRRQGVLLVISYLSVVYIFLFVSKNRTVENLHHGLIQKEMLNDFLDARPMQLVHGSLGSRAYRVWLFLLLLCACLGCLLHLWRGIKNKHFQAGAVCVAAAFCMLVILPFLPRSINGSDYFADRLVIYVWFFAIAGALASIPRNSGLQRALAGILAVIALTVPAIATRRLRSVSTYLISMERDTARAPGQRGVYLWGPVTLSNFDLTFDPWVWSATRYFRATGTVMMNAPWLDLPILPIAPRRDLFANLLPPKINDYPDHFMDKISTSSDMRELLSKHADFLVQITYGRPAEGERYDDFSHGWPKTRDCQRSNWYVTCLAGPGRSNSEQ